MTRERIEAEIRDVRLENLSLKAELQRIKEDREILKSPPLAFGDSTFFNDVWRSSDSGVSWELVTDDFNRSWPARAYFQEVTKQYMYLIGGQDSTAIRYPNLACGADCPPYFNDTWRFSPEWP